MAKQRDKANITMSIFQNDKLELIREHKLVVSSSFQKSMTERKFTYANQFPKQKCFNDLRNRPLWKMLINERR